MVTPITGPYNTILDRIDVYRYRNAYRQAKPYDRPLPFGVYGIKVLRNTEYPGRLVSEQSDSYVYTHPLVNQVRIRAYDKFKDQLGDRAELGVTLSEYSKAIDTVGELSLALYKVARSFKRGLTRPMWNELKKVKIRDVGSKQLAVSYGVLPTVQDLYNTINVLQSPIKSGRISARSGGYQLERWPIDGSNGNYGRYLISRETKVSVKYGCDILISNPNLFLANQLGLVNPLSFLTERTPLSFVLGWFVNIDQFMAMSTDFLGLEQVNPYTSTRVNQRKIYQWATYGWVGDYQHDVFIRDTGITTPSLGFRQFQPWGWRRAANAVSLLTNHLRSF